MADAAIAALAELNRRSERAASASTGAATVGSRSTTSAVSTARTSSPKEAPTEETDQDDESTDDESDDETEDEEADELTASTSQTEATASTNQTEATRKRNKKTEDAHRKRRVILANGGPAPFPCYDCVRANLPCVVWNTLSVVCGHCAGKKLKCEFGEALDAEEIHWYGVPAKTPCVQCVQKGRPGDCIQANDKQKRRFGTACSECMGMGDKQFCSINLKPKRRKGAKSVRRM